MKKTGVLCFLLILFFISVSTNHAATPGTNDIITQASWADVKTFGAKDDGASDATVAIQAALNSPANTIVISGNVYKITDQLNVPAGKRVISDGKTIIRVAAPIAWPKVAIRLNGDSSIEGVALDANCSFAQGVILPDGAAFGIMAINSNHNKIINCSVYHAKTVGIGIYAVNAAAGDEAHFNLIENCRIENYDFVNAGVGIGGLGIIVRADYPGSDAEHLGDFDHYNYTYTYKVTNNRIMGNTIVYGLLAIALNNTAKNIVEGNTIIGSTGTGIEVEPKALHNTVSANSIHDCGGGGLSVADGSHNNVIDANVVTGVHGVYNYAIAIFYYSNDNVISDNVLDSRFDRYTGPQNRAPGNGILVAHYCRNAIISGNTIKGYRYGIHAETTMYPGAVKPRDPEYYRTGFQNITIRGNIIQGAYVSTQNKPPRLAMPQNTLYGIWIDKNTAYDDSVLGALAYTGIVVDGNTVDRVEYPYIISEVTAKAANPAHFEDVVFRNNKAANNSSSSGLKNYAQQSNVQLKKIKTMDNSWNFIPPGAVPPSPLVTKALYGQGDTILVSGSDFRPGAVYKYEWQGTEFLKYRMDGVATAGDENIVCNFGETAPTVHFAAPLSVNRTVTLNTSGVPKGSKYRIVRTGLGTGTLDVGGLKTIPAGTAAFVDVEFNGSAWILTGYGLL